MNTTTRLSEIERRFLAAAWNGDYNTASSLLLSSSSSSTDETDTEVVNVDCIDKYGYTILHNACQKGNMELMQYLLCNTKANINYANTCVGGGETPLHRSCACVQYDAVKLLLQKGATINAVNSFGFTPLHNAILNLTGHHSVHWNNNNNNKDRYNIILLLIEYGANINAVTNKGYTPLHCIAWSSPLLSNKLRIVQLMIQSGCPTNIIAKTDQGETPALLAYRYLGKKNKVTNYLFRCEAYYWLSNNQWWINK